MRKTVVAQFVRWGIVTLQRGIYVIVVRATPQNSGINQGPYNFCTLIFLTKYLIFHRPHAFLSSLDLLPELRGYAYSCSLPI